MSINQEIFQTQYTVFDNNIGSFDADEFIRKRKYIRYGNSHLWHQKYSIPCTKVLGFVARRVTSKVIGIGTAQRYWGDVKTIKYGKRSAISSYVSDKKSIVYTYACIESAIIEQYHSDKQLNEKNSSHTWIEEDDAFDHQLENGVWKKYFQIIQNLLQES